MYCIQSTTKVGLRYSCLHTEPTLCGGKLPQRWVTPTIKVPVVLWNWSFRIQLQWGSPWSSWERLKLPSLQTAPCANRIQTDDNPQDLDVSLTSASNNHVNCFEVTHGYGLSRHLLIYASWIYFSSLELHPWMFINLQRGGTYTCGSLWGWIALEHLGWANISYMYVEYFSILELHP